MNHEHNWKTHKNNELDRALDAALAQYSAIEPRDGLEERILAHLQYRREYAPARAWWRWGVAATCATVVFVIIGLAWPGSRRGPAIVHHLPEMKTQMQLPAPQTASTRRPALDSMAKPVPHHSKSPAPAYPKLDQFPSPQPLSDQEKILANYVETNPHHAVLVARARTEALLRDQIEETRSYSLDDGTLKVDDQNEDRNDR